MERYFDSNRAYDSLHFVLSEWRREGIVDQYSGFPERLDAEASEFLFELAMLGDEILFCEAVYDGHLRNLQGQSARYLSPAQVRKIAHALSRKEPTDLQTHCSREQMERVFVYKPIGDWNQLRGYFEQLREFYIVTAEAGEGVIVSTV